jgi:hypothetical protein
MEQDSRFQKSWVKYFEGYFAKLKSWQLRGPGPLGPESKRSKSKKVSLQILSLDHRERFKDENE